VETSLVNSSSLPLSPPWQPLTGISGRLTGTGGRIVGISGKGEQFFTRVGRAGKSYPLIFFFPLLIHSLGSAPRKHGKLYRSDSAIHLFRFAKFAVYNKEFLYPDAEEAFILLQIREYQLPVSLLKGRI